MALSTSQPERGIDRTEVVALLDVTVIVFGVAAIFLWHRQLWTDESYSWAVSRTSLSQFQHFLFSPHGELDMALDYVLLRPFVSSHFSDLWMRIPSLVAMVATVPVVWLLADRLTHSRFVRVAAVVIFLTQPLVVDYAFEARSYGLLVLGLTAATLLLVLALDGSRAAAVGYAVLLPVLISIHFLGLFVVAAQAMALFLVTPGGLPARFGRTLRLCGLGIVVGVGSSFIFVRQSTLSNSEPVSLSSLIHTAYDITGRAGPLSILFVAATLAGFVFLFNRRHEQPGGLVVILTAVVPVVLALVLSVSRPMIMARYQLLIVPLLCICAAVGIHWAVRDRQWRLATLATFALLGLVGQAFIYSSPNREAPDSVSAYVLAHARPGDVVAFNSPGAELSYHRFVVTGHRRGPLEVGPVANPALPHQGVTRIPIDQAIARLPAGASLWLMARQDESSAGHLTADLASHGLRHVSTAIATKISVQRWVRTS